MKGSQGMYIVFLQYIGSQEKDVMTIIAIVIFFYYHLLETTLIMTIVTVLYYFYVNLLSWLQSSSSSSSSSPFSHLNQHELLSNSPCSTWCMNILVFYFLYWLFNPHKLYFQEIRIAREDFETARCSTTKSCLILSPCQKVRFFLSLFPCFYANLKLFKIIRMPLSRKWVTCGTDIIQRW